MSMIQIPQQPNASQKPSAATIAAYAAMITACNAAQSAITVYQNSLMNDSVTQVDALATTS